MTEIHERSIDESDFATVLCQDIVLVGKLHCEQPILLNCRFEGTLLGEDKVVIYHDAVLKGTIRAKSIRVAGQVEGDLFASELIELESSGSIFGNITAPTVVMENGSVFEGQSHILRDSSRRPSAAVPTSNDANSATASSVQTAMEPSGESLKSVSAPSVTASNNTINRSDKAKQQSATSKKQKPAAAEKS